MAMHHRTAPDRPVRWRRAPGLVDYAQALDRMDAVVASIRDGTTPEEVWLVEHPPLYTAGTSAKAGDLLEPADLPVFPVRRGGQYTYHGPGQRVAYLMLDLKNRGSDVRRYVYELEEWVIRSLAAFEITGERREGRVGIWVAEGDREAKIAAIGVRVRRWVTSHGIALNLSPNLEHFAGIVPCGIRDHGVTSMTALGRNVSMDEVDRELRRQFEAVFQVTTAAS